MAERRPIGWWALALAVVLGAGGLALTLAAGSPELPGNADDPLPVALASTGFLLPFAIVGALVASRRPENPIGWIFCAVALMFGVDTVAEGWSAYAVYGAHGLPGAGIAAWVESWLVAMPLFVGPLFLLLLFPSGRLLTRSWRPVAWLVGVLVLGVFAMSLRPGPFEEWSMLHNPLGIGGSVGRALQHTDAVLNVLASGLFIASATSLALRLRRSRGLERLQIKWVVYAASVAGLGFSVNFFVPDRVSGFAFWIGAAGLVGIPVAAGIAILRYRLYEIDRVINRTLVYAALTATLGGVYLGSVLLLQLALDSFTSGSSLAVAVSTLGVAALFRPARARIQAVVDRRFYRRNYDAARTLEGFSSRLRHEVDLEALGGELRAVVVDTMQPAHVSLWLRPPPLRRP